MNGSDVKVARTDMFARMTCCCHASQAQSGRLGSAIGKKLKDPATVIDVCCSIAKKVYEGYERNEQAKAHAQRQQAMQPTVMQRMQQDAAMRQKLWPNQGPPGGRRMLGQQGGTCDSRC